MLKLGQIAGRAGRYKNDGFFGTTGDCENINPDEVEKLENHTLPETKIIYWRNSDLDFKTPEKLITSLEFDFSEINNVKYMSVEMKRF